MDNDIRLNAGDTLIITEHNGTSQDSITVTKPVVFWAKDYHPHNTQNRRFKVRICSVCDHSSLHYDNRPQEICWICLKCL